MGHANSKLTEEITIGYIHDNDIRKNIRISTKNKLFEEKEEEIDRIIELPHQYGIYNTNQPCTLLPPPSLFLPHSPYFSSSSSSSSSLSILNNITTLSPISLKNDLQYIDSTYYNNSTTTTLKNKYNNNTNNKQIIISEEQERQQKGKKITLKDLQAIDNLIRVISLSQLDLTSLSSNIGLFDTLRKLDL